MWGRTKGVDPDSLFDGMPISLWGDITLSLYGDVLKKVLHLAECSYVYMYMYIYIHMYMYVYALHVLPLSI